MGVVSSDCLAATDAEPESVVLQTCSCTFCWRAQQQALTLTIEQLLHAVKLDAAHGFAAADRSQQLGLMQTVDLNAQQEYSNLPLR